MAQGGAEQAGVRDACRAGARGAGQGVHRDAAGAVLRLVLLVLLVLVVALRCAPPAVAGAAAAAAAMSRRAPAGGAGRARVRWV